MSVLTKNVEVRSKGCNASTCNKTWSSNDQVTSNKISTRIDFSNWDRSQQTYWSGIHTWNQVPNLDRKHYSIKKENGQIRVYVDFQGLNQTCSKDDFHFQ